MINMDISYENFSINPVVNGFIAEEDMKRFVTYGSQDKYKALRGSGPLDENSPVKQNPGKDTRNQPALRKRELGFLAPVDQNSEETARLSTNQDNDFWKTAGGS